MSNYRKGRGYQSSLLERNIKKNSLNQPKLVLDEL